MVKDIMFLKTFGNYNAGDGLQVDDATALAYVTDGIAAYSGHAFACPTTDSAALHSALRHDGT